MPLGLSNTTRTLAAATAVTLVLLVGGKLICDAVGADPGRSSLGSTAGRFAYGSPGPSSLQRLPLERLPNTSRAANRAPAPAPHPRPASPQPAAVTEATLGPPRFAPPPTAVASNVPSRSHPFAPGFGYPTYSSWPASAEAAGNESPPQPPSPKDKVKLADQPRFGDHYKQHDPKMDAGVHQLPFSVHDFHPGPIYDGLPYDSHSQLNVYQGKHLNPTQRPLVEIGRPFYMPGQFPESSTLLGATNLIAPQLLVYGDFRTGVAYNQIQGDEVTRWAFRLNLDIDLKLTSTERFHAFIGPLDQGVDYTRLEYDNDQFSFLSELDTEFDTAYFEGDLGAMVGGLTGEVLPFDLPFTVGAIPLFFQNGIWLDDAFLGMAATIPARNSPLLDIPNMDITFFYGFDKINSPAFGRDDNAARLYGVTSFLEAWGGYIEAGYAFLDDRSVIDRSYHNIGVSYTRRYGRLISNSVRVIANGGQSSRFAPTTADGVLLLVENSLITSSPYNIVPYFNFFAGFGRPQSVARAANVGGILKNTGINFETDGLTGYPTLDDTGNNTWGGAVGVNLLASDLGQQLILEAAMVQAFGNPARRNAAGDQYGLGLRYQLPVTNAILVRFDAMYGFLENADNVSGLRVELRHKF